MENYVNNQISQNVSDIQNNGGIDNFIGGAPNNKVNGYNMNFMKVPDLKGEVTKLLTLEKYNMLELPVSSLGQRQLDKREMPNLL
jgi:hypothetical protein